MYICLKKHTFFNNSGHAKMKYTYRWLFNGLKKPKVIHSRKKLLKNALYTF